jgi:hypothetical protein
LIMGSGRSGTSLVAAMAQRAGYHLGDPLQPPNPGNPLGRFESFEVNAINEALLAPALPRRQRGSRFGNLFLSHVPLLNQRWLAAIPVDKTIAGTPALTARMVSLVERQPYCFKDPRFSYTLSAWQPILPETRFVCVFRHPAETAESILREHREEPALHSLAMDFDRAIQVWMLMYRHILEKHCHTGQWLFVHYQQMLSGDGVDRLAEFLGAMLDRSVIDPGLHRSRPTHPVPQRPLRLYAQLCALAGWAGP